MALYYYKCDTCGMTRKKLSLIAPWPCEKDLCLGTMRRSPKPPTANVVERLDSGNMPRAVERPADAERLYHERAHKKPEE